VSPIPIPGASKGAKLARYDLIPVEPLRLLAEHFGRGAAKYSERNYERGYAWSLSYAALQRHANQFWGGEDLDPETGSPHLIAVAWHALALVEFMRTHPEKDDRVRRTAPVPTLICEGCRLWSRAMRRCFAAHPTLPTDGCEQFDPMSEPRR
jgi:hypothetical protein